MNAAPVGSEPLCAIGWSAVVAISWRRPQPPTVAPTPPLIERGHTLGRAVVDTRLVTRMVDHAASRRLWQLPIFYLASLVDAKIGPANCIGPSEGMAGEIYHRGTESTEEALRQD
ncbi:hypothetical protein Spa11_42600 [Botrimarina mediterranea]|uniref:Uncharacterized protein n=1 Tax=Botrimarina mediterranea TaxID=2528022 RepID=A0A518KE09_9BACT|nr:hypothetical protein Spa11_42600 [Botrimarina mediterranea]